MEDGKKIALKTKSPVLKHLLDLLVNNGFMPPRCYIVGGAVRNALIELPFSDLDVVVEGKKNALSVASRISEKLKISYMAHQSFGTYVFKVSGDSFDIATARRENYPRPASLPVVNFDATIEDDLFRRDFTINAMAVPLTAIGKVDNGVTYNKKKYFFYPKDVIDLYGGIKDLSSGLIRVIHNNSFMDDPTRIIRAARFAARFDFTIEKNTLSLVKDDRRIKTVSIRRLSGARIGNELILISKEKYPLKVLNLLYKLDVLKSFFPDINLDKFRRWNKNNLPEATFSPAGFLSEFISVMDIPPVDFLNKCSISRTIKKEVLALLRRRYG